MHQRVLILGYRQPIAERLHALDIPFEVWHDKPFRSQIRSQIRSQTIPGCNHFIANVPFPQTVAGSNQVLQRLFPSSTRFTHVIAGSEASVVAASVAREWLGARMTDHAMALRCRDKRLMKSWLKQHDIPLVPYVDLTQVMMNGRNRRRNGPTRATASQLVSRLGLPLVIKVANLSGRRGMTIARTLSDIEQALISYDSQLPLLAEQYHEAEEVSVESLIDKGEILFSNITEYVDKTWVNLVPSRHPPETHQRVLELHQRVVKALGIEWGIVHTEYFVGGVNSPDEIVFGEIAIRPPGGYIMDLISLAYGFDAWDSFVKNNTNLACEFPVHPVRTAAAVLFHPGAGWVEQIDGMEEIEADPHRVKLQLLRKPGQWIEPRTRVSNAAAYAIFCSPTAEQTLSSVDRARKLLRFKTCEQKPNPKPEKCYPGT